MAKNEELFNAIMAGKRDDVVALVQAAIDGGDDIAALLDESMIPAMREMGDRFSRNEVYVPQMLIAARAMQSGLELVEPILADTSREPLATVVIGTVKGDLHDIGKNLVAIMLKGAGYNVIDLGVNVDAAKFKAAVDEHNATIVCLSALLTTTMPEMEVVVNEFKDMDGVKTIIGGAPVTDEFKEKIGADGFGADANLAVKAADEIIGKVA